MIQDSVKVRNAMLDAMETQIGTAPLMEIINGDMPANCAAATAGTVVASGSLPSDWLSAAAAGAISKNGTWTLTGTNTGPARYYRIYRAGSPSECDQQGTVGPTGSPTYDMTVDNVNIAPAQVVTVTSYTRTRGNA